MTVWAANRVNTRPALAPAAAASGSVLGTVLLREQTSPCAAPAARTRADASRTPASTPESGQAPSGPTVVATAAYAMSTTATADAAATAPRRPRMLCWTSSTPIAPIGTATPSPATTPAVAVVHSSLMAHHCRPGPAGRATHLSPSAG